MVTDFCIFGYDSKNLLWEGTTLKQNITREYLFYHIAGMKELDDHIFDVITKL